MNRMIDYYKSPIGILRIAIEDGKLVGLAFVSEKVEEKVETELSKKVKKQLKEYFNGTRREFDIPLSFHGTEFQEKVWTALSSIPFGTTCSYKYIAELVDNPKGVRAVGNANNKNPICIIIPCHRVIGSNNKLVGYGGGIVRKQALIEHEQYIIEK